MSRGHGSTQRAVLELLNRWPITIDEQARPLSVAELTRQALGDNAQRSEIESVRRAARRLVDEGHLQRLDDGRLCVAGVATLSDSRKPSGAHYRARRTSNQQAARNTLELLHATDLLGHIDWGRVTPEDWWLPTVRETLRQLRRIERDLQRQQGDDE